MNLLISADWHLSDNKPRCRTDEDWFSFLRNVLNQVLSFMNTYKCSLVIVGDLFDKYDVSYRILNLVLKFINKIPEGLKLYFIEGNHDLPFHSQSYKNNSAIEVLNHMVKWHYNIGWIGSLGNYKNFNGEIEGKNEKIMFIHQLVFDSISNIPKNSEGITAKDLLNEYPEAKFIFCGDNHKKFIHKKDNRFVINPGSLFRSTSDQKNYEPSLYLVNTDKDIIKEIKIKDSIELVDDEYITKEKEKIEEIKAFVEGVKTTNLISLDYIKNVKRSIIKSKLDEDIKKEVFDLIEETKEE